ncbi:hypothetical protein ACH3XW_37030 [Acanthocheilonema viteae]
MMSLRNFDCDDKINKFDMAIVTSAPKLEMMVLMECELKYLGMLFRAMVISKSRQDDFLKKSEILRAINCCKGLPFCETNYIKEWIIKCVDKILTVIMEANVRPVRTYVTYCLV